MVIDLTRLMVPSRRIKKGVASLLSHPEFSEPPGICIGLGSRGEPVFWPRPSATQASHALVLAASGTGKSVLTAYAVCAQFIESYFQRPEEECETVFLVDPKGDLVSLVFGMIACHAPELLPQVQYLNPFEQGFPFNLNHLEAGNTPLDIRAWQLATLASETSTATGSQRHLGTGARQLDVLTNLLLAALSLDDPQASVLLALDALTMPKGLKLLGSICNSERARQFLLSANLSDELKASCAARLRLAFAATESLEHLVSTPNCISFPELLSPGKLTLIDLGSPTGGLAPLQRFWANLLVRLGVDHLLSRKSPWQGHHARLVIDEAQLVASVLSEQAENLLTTGRSRGISLTLLSQGTVLLKEASNSLLRVLMGNAPIKILGRLSAPDAELMAKEMAPQPGISETTAVMRRRVLGSLTNLPDQQFMFMSPGKREPFIAQWVNLENWESATQYFSAQIQTMTNRFRVETRTRRLHLWDISPPKQKRRAQSRKTATRTNTRWG
jgi:hypothetical protein